MSCQTMIKTYFEIIYKFIEQTWGLINTSVSFDCAFDIIINTVGHLDKVKVCLPFKK